MIVLNEDCIGADNCRLGTVVGSERGSFDFAMASPRFYFTGDDLEGGCGCVCVASNEDPAEENPTRKGTTKQERGKQTRSKDKKKEVWESKWAILISLEVKIYACQSTCPI